MLFQILYTLLLLATMIKNSFLNVNYVIRRTANWQSRHDSTSCKKEAMVLLVEKSEFGNKDLINGLNH